jgi:hypothetical protein
MWFPGLIVLGLILLVVGLAVKTLSILFTIGWILIVLGVVLWIVGAFAGRNSGSRF